VERIGGEWWIEWPGDELIIFAKNNRGIVAGIWEFYLRFGFGKV